MDFQQQQRQSGSEAARPAASTRTVLLAHLHGGAPQLTVGLSPRRPIVSRRYLKLEMHLIHLTCPTSQLSHAAPQRAQSTDPGLGLDNHLEFQPAGNCLPLLLTRSGRHRWALCRHHRMGKHNVPKPLAACAPWMPVLYPRSTGGDVRLPPDWERTNI